MTPLPSKPWLLPETPAPRALRCPVGEFVVYETPFRHLLDPVTDPVSEPHSGAGPRGTAPGFPATSAASSFAAHSSAGRWPGSGEEAFAAEMSGSLFRGQRDPGSVSGLGEAAHQPVVCDGLDAELLHIAGLPPAPAPPEEGPAPHRQQASATRRTALVLVARAGRHRRAATTAVVATVSVPGAAACDPPLHRVAAGAAPPGVVTLWPRPYSSRSGGRGLARMLHGAGSREPSALRRSMPGDPPALNGYGAPPDKEAVEQIGPVVKCLDSGRGDRGRFAR